MIFIMSCGRAQWSIMSRAYLHDIPHNFVFHILLWLSDYSRRNARDWISQVLLGPVWVHSGQFLCVLPRSDTQWGFSCCGCWLHLQMTLTWVEFRVFLRTGLGFKILTKQRNHLEKIRGCSEKDKQKVANLGGNNGLPRPRIGGWLAEQQLCKGGVEVMVDSRLTVSHRPRTVVKKASWGL